MIIIKCKQCGEEFFIYPSRKKRKNYCSKGCHNKSIIGRIPWNKGLKLGKNPEHSKRMSGKNHPNFGMYLSEETKRKICIANKKNPKIIKAVKKQWENQEFRKKMSEVKIGKRNHFYGKHHTKEIKIKLSKVRKGKTYQEIGLLPMSKITKKKIGLANKGKRLSKEVKEKLSKINKEKWQDTEYAKKMFKAFAIKPNKPEIYLTQFLQQILPNEYKYVGDGQFILGGKCPDFMNINGKKKLIELYGDYWHRNHNPQDRIDYFKQYGFNTLIIWEKELKDKNLQERILNFNSI